MAQESRLAALEARLAEYDAVILGLKKEVGMLRRQLASANGVEHAPDECRLGLGDECSRAGTYQYQQGCRGTPCKVARAKYYNQKPLPMPKKRMMKRAE